MQAIRIKRRRTGDLDRTLDGALVLSDVSRIPGQGGLDA